MLARNPPIKLQAEKLRVVYLRKKVAVEGQIKITDSGLNIIRRQEQDKLVVKWRRKLIEKADTGRGFNLEIVSCLKEWMGRSHGELTFQATQLITDHGCFKGYTQRIGKTENGEYSFCNHNWEDNVHVLFDCREWEGERERMLMREFGGRLGVAGGDDAGDDRGPTQVGSGDGIFQRGDG